MSKDLNLCQFIGRLGKDVELRYLSNGEPFASLSIACSDDYNDKNTGEKIEQTNWIRVITFGNLAKIIGEYCKKGRKIYISGKQRTRKWTDQNGMDRYSTEIIANTMQLLGGRAEAANALSTTGAHPGVSSAPPPQAVPMGMDYFDQEIPF